ncbi:MAG: ribulose-phosphate 3-epimerase [Balneolales bacterium]
MFSIPTPILAPSILSANFRNLENDISKAIDGGARWIHCDIMDGHFVPNISYGPMIVDAVRSCTDAYLDVHLMIENPDYYIPAFAKAGANLISVHIEACPHLHRTLQLIREQGCLTGVAVNPGTALSTLRAVLEDTDLILLMSVNPGFAAQEFIHSTFERLRALRLMRDELQKKFYIEVDGGINLRNVREIASSGADVIVAGSSIFHHDDITEQVKALRNNATSGYRSELT